MDTPLPSAPSAPSHGARRYLAVWLALLALTATTYLLSRMDLGGHWNLVAALLVAVSKGALVALFFMHLWDERGLHWLVLVVSLVFVLLLMAGVVSDMATRNPLARPPEATGLLGAGQGGPPPAPGRGP